MVAAMQESSGMHCWQGWKVSYDMHACALKRRHSRWRKKGRLQCRTRW